MAATLGLVQLPIVAFGKNEATAAHVEAGAKTRGGLVRETRVIRVATLASSGEGTLREALAADGPRVIVFDVAGVIELESNLKIANPQVTVAGQTAPTPGIVLRGAKLHIAAHDVVVQHLSFFPVSPMSLAVKADIDAISVGPCSRCVHQVSNVRLENVSAGWSTDEIIGLWGAGLSHITIRNSLLAEALNQAGHHKGHHSMGLLIGGKIEAVEVVGNLFASNKWRNPVVGAGASAYVANNFIHNPGKAALHVYGDRSDQITRASFIGNVVKRGPSSEPSVVTAVRLPSKFKEPSRGAIIFAVDNHCCTGSGDAGAGTSGMISVDTPPVTSPSWTPFSAERVWSWVVHHAGSRPRERSAFDARVLTYVAEGTGAIIDGPAEVGGYPTVVGRTQAAAVPVNPLSSAPTRLSAHTRLEAWLCLRHLEVGGPLTPECPDNESALRAFLSATP